MCVGSRDGHLVGNSCERIGHRAWDVASRARNKRRRRSGAAQKLRDQLALAEDVQTIRAHRPGGTELLLHAERRLLEQRVMRILVINDDSNAARLPRTAEGIRERGAARRERGVGNAEEAGIETRRRRITGKGARRTAEFIDGKRAVAI